MSMTIFDGLISHWRAFRADEDGAVTVDFVVMTSFVVMMGLAHAKDVADGTTALADDIEGCIGTDVAAVLDGNPQDFVANLEAAAAACNAR